MNVSELTNVELNRAMIWLYADRVDCAINHWFQRSLEELSEEGLVGDDGMTFEVNLGEWEWDVNFLSGYLAWDLTMPLAVEDELEIAFLPKTRCENGYDGLHVSCADPLRAICEVLVMIKLEGDK